MATKAVTETKKEKQTVRREVKLDKPKQVENQIQVHRGNIDVLTLKFKEQEVIHLANIVKALNKIVEKLYG